MPGVVELAILAGIVLFVFAGGRIPEWLKAFGPGKQLQARVDQVSAMVDAVEVAGRQASELGGAESPEENGEEPPS